MNIESAPTFFWILALLSGILGAFSQFLMIKHGPTVSVRVGGMILVCMMIAAGLEFMLLSKAPNLFIFPIMLWIGSIILFSSFSRAPAR